MKNVLHDMKGGKMKVQELIDFLNKIENKNAEVSFDVRLPCMDLFRIQGKIKYLMRDWHTGKEQRVILGLKDPIK